MAERMRNVRHIVIRRQVVIVAVVMVVVVEDVDGQTLQYSSRQARGLREECEIHWLLANPSGSSIIKTS